MSAALVFAVVSCATEHADHSNANAGRSGRRKPEPIAADGGGGNAGDSGFVADGGGDSEVAGDAAEDGGDEAGSGGAGMGGTGGTGAAGGGGAGRGGNGGAGAGGTSGTGGGSAAGRGGAGGSAMAGAGGAPAAPGKFSEIYAMIFFRCNGAYCHGNSGGLSLSPQLTAYQNLVGVDSTQCAGQKRVVAGDPQASVLVHQLQHTTLPGCTLRGMPLYDAKRPQSEIDLVTSWIKAGALNN